MDSSTTRLVESSNDNRDSQQDTPSASTVFQTIALPSGRRARNRLVKVAMYEHLASLYGGPPTAYHFNLYSEWAKHGWGIIITGNVAITDDHLTLGRDIILPPSSEINSENAILPFKRLAQAIHGIVPDDRTTNVDTPAQSLAIMQLNHAGRQSSNLLGGRLPFKSPLAPSSIRVTSSDSSLLSRFLNAFMFQLPTEMTQKDINKAIDRFVEGAVLAYRAGFDGVQIHAAHGYLLAQFLSPKSNTREDAYSVQNALDIIQTIALLIRESTSSTFIICIKMNAAEYSSTVDADYSMSEMEERALGHLFTMATWGLIDFVEISGGDYEKPDFMMAEEVAKSQRQAFFANFSHKALRALESLQGSVSTRLPLILLTGGFKSLDLLDTALDQKHAHLLGIGRASVTCPELPRVVRERSKDPRQWDGKPFGRHPELRKIKATWITTLLPRIKIVGAGIEMAWYVVTMRDVAMGIVDPALTRGGLGSIIWMWTPLGLYAPQLQRQRTLSLLLLAALPPFIAYLIQRIHA